jgi:integration host factor subunit alpha
VSLLLTPLPCRATIWWPGFFTDRLIDKNWNLCDAYLASFYHILEPSMSLTKQKIIDQVGIQLGCTKDKSTHITETLIELIKSTLESGTDVLVSGFGKFCVKEKAERKGRNPARGENMILPARRVVTFKCSNRLRAMVNSGQYKRKAGKNG